MIKFINPTENEEVWEFFKDYFPSDLDVSESRWIPIGVVEAETDTPAGALAYVEEDSRYLITWLYVEEEMQRNGIANQILDLFLEYIGDEFKDIEMEFTSEEDGLIDFFSARDDFEVQKIHETYRITYNQFMASETIEKAKEVAGKAEKFFELSDLKREEIYLELANTDTLYLDNKKSFEELCEPDLCLCSYKDGAKALILTSYVELDDYEIVLIHAEDAASFKEVFSAFVKKFEKLYKGCNLVINPQSEGEKKIVDYYFKDRSKVSENYVAEWNFGNYKK